MSHDLIGKILALSAAFIWAFAVILFKRSGETIRPAALNLLKSALALLLFIGTLFISDIAFFPDGVTSHDYIRLCLSGIFGITVADTLFFMSLNRLGAGLSAIVDCLYAPILIGLSWLVLNESITSIDLIGAFLVISAILLISHKSPHAHVSPRKIIEGIALGGFSMLFVGIAVILMKPVVATQHVLWVTEFRLLCATTSLFILILLQRDSRALLLSLGQRKIWRFALPGAFLGNYVSMIAWVGAFKFTKIGTAAVLNQMSTIFIIALASLILKEKFTVRRLLSLILGVSGSLLILLT